MDYSFRISDDFWDDFFCVLNFYEEQMEKPSISNRLARKTYQMLDYIKDNPFMFPIHHIKSIAKKDYRFAVIENYLIFYRYT